MEAKHWEKKRKGKRKENSKQRKKNREIEWQTCTNRLISSFSLYKPCPLPKTKDSFGHKPFRSASLKMINFYGRIFPGRLFTLRRTVPSLVLTLWHNLVHQIDLFFFLLLTRVLPIYSHYFLYKVFLIIVIIILIGDYLFTLSKGKSTFFYYYYYVCLPWLIRSSSACYGHMNEVCGKRGIVCAQAGPKWVIVGPVSTLLFKTLVSNTAGGSPAQHCKKTHHI